jgi:hypothetical protein
MIDGTARIPFAHQLPADAYWHLVRTLRLTLPPPPGDGPDDLLRRDHAVIARVAALAPANAAEAELAGQLVAASEQWKDCLRLANVAETSEPRRAASEAPAKAGVGPEWAAKCRAQALGMMRQANSALRLLLRMQDARRKLEADNSACDRLAWTEHCAAALMAEALAQPPTPPAAQPAPLAAPVKERESEPAAEGKRSPGKCSGEGSASPAPLDQPDPVAEHYAILYPERASLIRRRGRLPHELAFGPPDDDPVQALISARSPALAALDRSFAGAGPVPRHAARAA